MFLKYMHLERYGNEEVDGIEQGTTYVFPELDGTNAQEQTTEAKVGSYYNFPFKDWSTVNDMIDHLSQKQWGWRSYIFKDIIKACFRFGQKEGTTEVYDAEKIIYYGCRLLMSVSDKATTRKYLQKLLDDKQFKENV